MADLIFSIKNIFNDTTNEGCLHQMDAVKFHIPAYQRGYKWGSKEENDPVPTLLRDLYESFKNAPQKKYYLQYITVSKKGEMIEVIDGQQRLTTLSIILSALNVLLDLENNIATGKLDYAIRKEIFSDHIYLKEPFLNFINQSWELDGIALNGQKENKQDIYYIYKATRFIYESFSKFEGDLEQFNQFILEQVILIVNEVEAHIDGEKVFKNLNSNKILLTEVELIKGLMLTKVVRTDLFGNKGKHFREILEIRASLGRKWDEMSAQADESKFSYFFFEERKGFIGILRLVAKMHGYNIGLKGEQSHFPLFNFYNSKVSEIYNLFEELQLLYGILKDWYYDPEIYNLFGYYSHINKGNRRLEKSSFLLGNLKKTKSKVLAELREFRSKLLNLDLFELKYGDYNNEIYNVLLAVNVFSNLNSNRRYNFYEHNLHSWTIEHIFPQAPEGKKQTLSIGQRKLIIDMLDGEILISPDILAILQKEERDDEEKELYCKALAQIGPLNQIGNLALLSGPINSSVGCGFFDEKRRAILRFINNGEYIPPHTFNVFSKAILGDNPGHLEMWTKTDMENHIMVIEGIIDQLHEEIIG
jgi:hypothetical protein